MAGNADCGNVRRPPTKGDAWNGKFATTFLQQVASAACSPAIFPPPHKVTAVSKVRAPDPRGKAALDTPTDLSTEAVSEISKQLNAILATTFALYLKTKNFHWHVSGPHFRDYHLLLDEQGEQIFELHR